MEGLHAADPAGEGELHVQAGQGKVPTYINIVTQWRILPTPRK